MVCVDALKGDGVRDSNSQAHVDAPFLDAQDSYGRTERQEKARLLNLEESLEVEDTYNMEDLAVVVRAEEDTEE